MGKKGKELPYSKGNPETIRQMFSKVAPSYDFGNALLSMQLHRLWNRALIRNVIRPANPEHLLDLCCGTGAIAFSYLKGEEAPRQVTMVDFCEEMLLQAQSRAKEMGLERHAIHYQCADAQEIPLRDENVDCVTIAYGIRNIKDTERCLRETYRVLRPGGVLGILELTQPKNPFIRWGHRFYLNRVLPLIGRMFLADHEAYRYLGSSIQQFTSPQKLKEILSSVGYRDVVATSLFCGTATILSAKK